MKTLGPGAAQTRRMAATVAIVARRGVRRRRRRGRRESTANAVGAGSIFGGERRRRRPAARFGPGAVRRRADAAGPNVEAWLLSVERYFPERRLLQRPSRQELARLYWKNNRLDEAPRALRSVRRSPGRRVPSLRPRRPKLGADETRRIGQGRSGRSRSSCRCAVGSIRAWSRNCNTRSPPTNRPCARKACCRRKRRRRPCRNNATAQEQVDFAHRATRRQGKGRFADRRATLLPARCVLRDARRKRNSRNSICNKTTCRRRCRSSPNSRRRDASERSCEGVRSRRPSDHRDPPRRRSPRDARPSSNCGRCNDVDRTRPRRDAGPSPSRHRSETARSNWRREWEPVANRTATACRRPEKITNFRRGETSFGTASATSVRRLTTLQTDG